MSNKVVIHWFRGDLRLNDNPALHHAAELGSVLPIYIWDEKVVQKQPVGGATCVWLHHSLQALNASLNDSLAIFQGEAREVFEKLIKQYPDLEVCFNVGFEPELRAQEQKVMQLLSDHQVKVHTFNGSLLWDPQTILKEDQTPYHVFTPFFKKGCMMAPKPRKPLPSVEKNINLVKLHDLLTVKALNLLPKISWDGAVISHWKVGEVGAQQTFDRFLKKGISEYKAGRDFPAKPAVSRLSPYLHFGEISVNQLWHEVHQLAQNVNTQQFLSELGWREFSHNLLWHHLDLSTKNLQSKFDHFEWENDPKKLKAWQRGKTGIPMVDAAMRELWQTGYMHNRSRMIVGSFLVKNLRIDWREGEKWFWDCLFDADLANNSASWQWIAGCGADAAPYFRIFNPVLQGQKFDPDGEYIKKYVPELKKLPLKYLFAPWEAPQEVLEQASVQLGRDYPHPIVDLKKSREAALKAFDAL